jgi:hypothetical protein
MICETDMLSDSNVKCLNTLKLHSSEGQSPYGAYFMGTFDV